mmetsp:Transcript_28699/g.60908  ORF Transcript_28699/g.60908 Transcript_28699/m.60908 type:complete len:474 (+) Transcript_28699:64-1485(+)
MSTAVSNLAKKFDFLQERAQRRPIREAELDLTSSDASKKSSISHLKEFYLQRLAKTEPNAAARLAGVQAPTSVADAAQPQASGQHTVLASAQHTVRPNFTQAQGATTDVEDLEIMCNNCFNLIRSSEATKCTGDPAACPIACRNGAVAEKPAGLIGLLDLKLTKLRAALEARLTDSNSKVNVMRHLTQLRYHIDTAAKWTPGCSEIGALSNHTVQQVKQLTATSRVLAPAVYIFSKRIENVVVQKERESRRVAVQATSPSKAAAGYGDSLALDITHEPTAESVADVNSIVSELDSDCGTQYAETLVTQEGGPTTDVGNVQDANDYLSLKNEDEQRRWFYSQCLTVKLACQDKTRARKILISDLYGKVRKEGVPIEKWIQWIRSQLMPDDPLSTSTNSVDTPSGKQPVAPGGSVAYRSPVTTVGSVASPGSQGDIERTIRSIRASSAAVPAPGFAPPLRTSNSAAQPISYARRT